MIKELRKSTGMNKKEFAQYFDIPYRTVQNWEFDSPEGRKCPDYLVKLMRYKLEHEGLIKHPPITEEEGKVIK